MYLLITGLDLHEVYLDNLARLEYVKPNAFSTLKNLRKISLSNNNDLKVIDPDAFDNSQKLNEVSIYLLIFYLKIKID